MANAPEPKEGKQHRFSQIKLRFAHPLAKLLRVEGIVLYPYVLFSRNESEVPRRILLHEMVHVRQVREMGWLRFYLSYLAEYVRHLARTRNHVEAYRKIRFEQEAYASEAHVVLTSNEASEIATALRHKFEKA